MTDEQKENIFLLKEVIKRIKNGDEVKVTKMIISPSELRRVEIEF